jgi:hypothetical protein
VLDCTTCFSLAWPSSGTCIYTDAEKFVYITMKFMSKTEVLLLKIFEVKETFLVFLIQIQAEKI